MLLEEYGSHSGTDDAFGWLGQGLFSFNEEVEPPPATMEYWRELYKADPLVQAAVAAAVGRAISRPGAERRRVVKDVVRQLNRIDIQLTQLPNMGAGPLNTEYRALAKGVLGQSLDDDQILGRGMAYAQFVAPNVQNLAQRVRAAVANAGKIPAASPASSEPGSGESVDSQGEPAWQLPAAIASMDKGQRIAAALGVTAVIGIGASLLLNSQRNTSP